MPAKTAKLAPNHLAIVLGLGRPGIDLIRIAKQVEQTPRLLQSVFAAIEADAARPRFAASKLLRIVSRNSPCILYPHFDVLLKFLKGKNSILKWNAIFALANMAAIDHQKKLDRIIDAYLAPICGPVMIDAANTIRGAALIAKAKPYLADKIARQVLQVENASYATPECRNVVIGHAVTALEQFYPAIHEKDLVQSFVTRQLSNPRPATGSKARSFCKHWPANLGPAQGR